MQTPKDALTWFEIPAADLPRATRFYETVLGRKLKPEKMGPHELAVFAYEEPGVGGCLIAGNGHTPAGDGTVVYLAVGPALDDALERVKRAGGKVALGKTALPEGMGVYAQVIDSEGNRVGLHAST
jgi:predicted enzyme related to lactoylglutathione lyase